MSESTDTDVLLLPAATELPQLLTQLHQLLETHDPRVIMIDRDQGTIMALPRGAVVTTEFTDVSLGMLLQQTTITFVESDTDARGALAARAVQDGVTPHTYCANAHDRPALGDTQGESFLWTNSISQGNLLLACQSERGWKLYGCSLS